PQTNQSSVAVSYPAAQAAGDTNIVVIGWNSNSSSVSSVTDSAGNSYQVAVPLATGSALSQTIYYAANINAAGAGSNVVTVKFSSSVPYADIRVLEYSGLVAASPFDAGASASGNSSAANSGSAHTTNANDVVIGAGITATTFSAAGSGFTSLGLSTPDGDLAEYEVVSTAGSYAATASVSTGPWLMQAAAFKAAGDQANNRTLPTISSFSSSPSQIVVGSSTTLSWNVANATSIAITPGTFSTTTLTGSTTVSPTSTTVYTLTATNANGSKTATTSVSVDSTPPTIPGSLTASATGTSTISLSWTPSADSSGPGLAGYDIYRCAGASCTPSALIGQSTTASYADAGLASSTAYTYAVAAYDTLGLASATSSPASATTGVPMAGTPTLVQHVATAMEQNPSTTFTIPLPNPAGSGNALILGVQYQRSGSVTSVTDNGGNHWVLGPTVTNDNHTMALYYALNVAGGTQSIKIVFAGNPIDAQAEASEFYNVETTSALDGSSSGNSTTAGAITTSVAGDLIYEWGADLSDSNAEGGAYNATTNIAAGNGFTLLSADLQVGAADQFEVQPAAGAISPSFSAPGSSTWGSLAIALKSAQAGTPPPPGIRIVHVQHTLLDSITVQGRPTPAVMQFPSSGNLLVGLFNGAQCFVSRVTDSAGNAWNTSAPIATFFGSSAGGCTGGAQVVYVTNAVTGSTLSNIRVSLSGQESNGDDLFNLYDVTGAAPAAFDKVTTAYGDQTSGGNLTTVSLTPSAANELVINNTAIDFQTINGVVGSGYIFDTDVNAADDDAEGPNGTPNSTLDEDNGYAHIFEPSMGTATFAYTYNTPANGGVQVWSSVSAAFVQATSTPPSVPQDLAVSGVTSSSVTLAWMESTDPNYASSALSYKIYRNGAQIATTAEGATSYTDTGLAQATSYTYTVSASDPKGNVSAQSQAVNATTSPLLQAPVITAQPASQAVVVGGTATFSVSASGSPAPSYQWQSEAAGSGTFANIAGATGASYTVSNVQPSQSGSHYQVIVSNSQGSVTSSAATLTVTSSASAITYVQSIWCQDAGAQGTSRSCAITPNPGNAVLAFCYSTAQNGTYTISDSNGNSYTVDATSSRSGISGAMAHAVNVAGGADTVTCSGARTGYMNVILAEYSGVTTVSPFDAEAANSGTSANPSAGSVTTTQSNDLIVAGFGNNNSANSTLSAGSGFTLRKGSGNGTSVFVGGLEDATASTVSSYTGNFTYSDTSGSWAAVMVALKN
ncbi:MAG: immunoglobulin domain-containing protein, partial [Terracidiphilus sp.]